MEWVNGIPIGIAYFQKLEEISKLQSQIDELRRYFTSANEIPVERATILAKDFYRIIGEPDPFDTYWKGKKDE